MAVGVGVKLHMQAILFKNPPPELVQTLSLLCPLLRCELTVLYWLPRLVVPPHIGNHHNVLPAEGLGQRRNVGHLGPHSVPRVRTVQVLEDGSCQYSHPVLVELLGQLHRIGGQISVWTELDPLISGLSDLAKKNLRRHLLRIAGEPDSPRVRCGTDRDRGHITSL